MRDLGCDTPTVLVRNPARTGELRQTAERLGVRPVISGELFSAPRPPAAGCQVASGLSMLLHQAVAQVELMTGRPGPVEAMRAALVAAAAARGG